MLSLSFFVTLLTLNFLSASCEVKNTLEDDIIQTYSGPGIYVGQVFVACQTGAVNDISFKIFSHGYSALGAEVRIAPGSEVIENSGILLGTKDIQTTQFGRSETINFTPSTAFELIEGQTYIWWLEMDIFSNNVPQDGNANQLTQSGGIEFHTYSNSSDPNLGPARYGAFGDFLKGKSASARMHQVLVFKMGVNNLGAEIPTMNEWGLFIFGLILLNLGVYFIHQKQSILSK